jgi:hypothetical protein
LYFVHLGYTYSRNVLPSSVAIAAISYVLGCQGNTVKICCLLQQTSTLQQAEIQKLVEVFAAEENNGALKWFSAAEAANSFESTMEVSESAPVAKKPVRRSERIRTKTITKKPKDLLRKTVISFK